MESTLTVRFVTRAEDFHELLQPVAIAHPFSTNLLDNILNGIISGRRSYEKCVYVVVYEDEKVIGGALRTSPQGYVLTAMSKVAAAAVGREVAKADTDPFPFLRGPAAAVRACHVTYTAACGRELRMEDLDYLYALHTLVPPPRSPGVVRAAVETDRVLLLAWLRQFLLDADVKLDAEAMTNEFLIMGTGRFLTIDGEPVSFVHRGEPMQRSDGPLLCRITTVYTPSEHRNRGLATATVAAVAEEIAALGAVAVLAAHSINPASNAVYRKLGFQHVEDYLMLFYK